MFAAFPSLTSRQLSEAMAYEAIDPWGEWRSDLRTGIMAATVANAWRAPETTAYTPSDFMPKFEPDEIEQDEDTEPGEATETEIAKNIHGAFDAIRAAMGNNQCQH